MSFPTSHFPRTSLHESKSSTSRSLSSIRLLAPHFPFKTLTSPLFTLPSSQALINGEPALWRLQLDLWRCKLLLLAPLRRPLPLLFIAIPQFRSRRFFFRDYQALVVLVGFRVLSLPEPQRARRRNRRPVVVDWPRRVRLAVGHKEVR